ncbi:MAG: DUF2802 domain-containing protein [Gammaproteobacteria bacterium]|nr:DUF2802 domain-containing protein [Gammaproteobacteria bacterium]
MNALVILISCLLFTASLAIWVWTRNKIMAFEQQVQKQVNSNHLFDEITALNVGSIGLGGRFLKLEKDLHTLSERIDKMQMQIQAQSPYAQAIHLAQRGGSIEEIVELCGISYNEASLLIMMHKQDKAA